MTIHMNGTALPARGAWLLGNEPLVFHCHHYNIALQRVIEEGLLDGAAPILTSGAQETVHALLSGVLTQNPQAKSVDERLAMAMEVARGLGFGVMRVERTGEGGKAHGERLHYALGWTTKHGKRSSPCCFFHAGWVAAAFDVAHGAAPGSHTAVETACMATGAPSCSFTISRGGKALPVSVGPGTISTTPVPGHGNTGNIQAQAIIDALGGMPLVGNEEGLIPAFGVYLTRHLANYYNRISYGFEAELARINPELGAAARQGLVEAGHMCSFHTFGGIALSAEWEGLISPMVKSKEDVFHGLVACANALGWGCWRTVELQAGKRCVVDVYGSYESNGHLAMVGKASHGTCYLHTGGIAGFMNLLWVGDVTTRPQLTAEYYNSIYSAPESFEGTEIRCRAKGDDRCTIVAERRSFQG